VAQIAVPAPRRRPPTPLDRIRNGRVALAGPLGTWIFFSIGALIVVVLLLPRAVHDPTLFLQLLFFGLASGAIYALIAIGYTMVYGIIELINFAHGDVFTLGAFISLTFIPIFGLVEGVSHGPVSWLALLVVVLITMAINGFVGMGIERVAYRPLRNAPRLAPLITAVGMSFVLEGIMFLWRGPFDIHFPQLLPGTRISFAGGQPLGASDIVVILVSVVLVLALNSFVLGSKLGRAMRATAQDRDAAMLMGISVDRTISLTFFIGSALAAAGGIAYGRYYGDISYQTGFIIGLYAFTSAVFGGIGNIQGAALGGLVIGLVAGFMDGYFSSTWTDVVVFAILILTLVFRPTGLLGMRVPEK
jgi:branched-chain amino acid transport system permease protein